MKAPAAMFLTALLVCCGCQTAKGPFAGSDGRTTLKQIATLHHGDTAEKVIEKLGSPASVEVIVPWLMYYAEDKEGYSYRVSFTLREPGKLDPKDIVERVTITTGLFDGAEPVVVWPVSKKKEANRVAGSD